MAIKANRPISENAMLIDIQHVKANYKAGTPETVYIIWRDLDTGKKYVNTIENPEIDLYFEKPEKRDHTYPKSYVYAADCNKVRVPYNKIRDAIIEDGGEAAKAMAKRIYQSKQYKELDEFLKYPYVYGGDIDVRAYYHYLWRKEHENNLPKPLHIGFGDIECCSAHVVGMANPETCPIDLVTIIDGSNDMSYTFALVGMTYELPNPEGIDPEEWERLVTLKNMYDERNRQEQELMNNLDDLKREVHEKFDELYPGMEYKFFFYKDEAKMIHHIFELIQKLDFDFVGWWNFEFDINYIIDRAKHLGIDPRVLFTTDDFSQRQCWFKKDKFHFAIKNKTDYFYTTGRTNFICQERIYAATRKGRSELRSYSLSYVAQKELEDDKYDYSEDGNIKTVGFRKYKRYLIYNIKDVLLQRGIEFVTNDIANYYMTFYQTVTPYDSVFKQTVKLRCIQYYFYLNNGLVPGMNINKMPFQDEIIEPEDDDDDESNSKKKGFEGALVGDSRLNCPVGQPLYGTKPTNNIFNFGIDLDMSAFYPNTIKVMNNEPSNLIFKCSIDAGQFDILKGEKPVHTISHIPMLPDTESDFVDDVAKECFDNFYTRDWLTAGHKWFNLPTIDKLYDAVAKKLG